MRAARVRTESMAQRLSKKPLSEGFELWDKGYTLGAMRLFIFKAETSPPFQLGPCLDALGHLLLALEEYADASENFGYAAEKYELIQQPILAAVMKSKAIEAMEGPEAALKNIRELLAERDPQRSASSQDAKTKCGIARAFGYAAELELKSQGGDVERAVKDAEYAISLGWDRVHTGMFTLAVAKQQIGDARGALEALEQSMKQCPFHLASFELASRICKELGENDKALTLINQGIELHPRSSMLREKAFLLSDMGKDTEALQFLEELIANPPPEETEAVTVGGGSTLCTLLKAKAAILADVGRMPEALEAAKQAVQQNSGDDEAAAMVADIQTAQSSS